MAPCRGASIQRGWRRIERRSEGGEALSAAFPLIVIEGAPHERGIAYGRQAKDRIQASVDTYVPAFADQAGLDWPTTKALAREFAQTIAGFDADAMAEIEGIAEGAGQEVEAIVALNARTELLNSQLR
jgi:isopenicillin-N N-acyltransferase like protein